MKRDCTILKCVYSGIDVCFLVNLFVKSKLCSKAMLIGFRSCDSSIHLVLLCSIVFQWHKYCFFDGLGPPLFLLVEVFGVNDNFFVHTIGLVVSRLWVHGVARW